MSGYCVPARSLRRTQQYRTSGLPAKDLVTYNMVREGVSSPGGPACIAHARDRLGQDIVGPHT